MIFQSQNLGMDDWEDDYSMIDDDESIPPWHSSSQEDISSSAGSEYTECQDETEVPVEEDTSGPTSDTSAQTGR